MPPETVAKKDNSALYTPAAIIIAGVLIGAGLMFGLRGMSGSTGTPTGTQPAVAKVNIKDVKTDNEPFIGPANAPVVLAFWSDYQCPYCKAFEVGGIPQIPIPAALPDLVTKYVQTGKLKIVFKDFPFLGNDSITAGEYGRAVWHLYPEQYFAWRTAMYVAQDAEGDTGFGNATTIDALITSKFPQMNDAKIKADVAANKSAYDAAMQADEAEGTSFGITGTPGFITGTQFIGGDAPLSSFTAVIDPQLK